VNPGYSGKKSRNSGKSGESGFSTPEFPGFAAETLTHNAAKLFIQTERYCRSRAYGVFPTYSLRGYYKDYSREVDREKLF
jgi:hypothetical protein